MPDIFTSPTSTSAPKTSSTKEANPLLKGISPVSQALSAFLHMPAGIRFETQEADEHIILLLRRHWITNVPWLLISLLLIIFPILILPFIGTIPLLSFNLPPSFIFLLILIWYLITFSYMLVNFLLWDFTVSIVTNERIVDIDFIDISRKEFSATRIAKVEDVTFQRGGLLRTLFDYGDVFVQTAGQSPSFEFLAVPRPEAVTRIINGLMGVEEEEGEHNEH